MSSLCDFQFVQLSYLIRVVLIPAAMPGVYNSGIYQEVGGEVHCENCRQTCVRTSDIFRNIMLHVSAPRI